MLAKEKVTIDEYFKKDIPGIQEQAFYMLKARIGPIIEEVFFQKF